MRKMIVVLALLVAALTNFASAQTSTSTPEPARPAPGWERLQGLPSGIGIHVHGPSGGNCAFKLASETQLVCADGSGVLHTYQRRDISKVQLRHRGRSAVAGLAIGVGVAIVAGVATCHKGDIIGPGGCSAVISLPFGLIGAIAGASTDFTRSTVYVRP